MYFNIKKGICKTPKCYIFLYIDGRLYVVIDSRQALFSAEKYRKEQCNQKADDKVYCSSDSDRKDKFAKHDAQDYCNCRRSKSEVEEDHLDYRADELCNFVRKRQ